MVRGASVARLKAGWKNVFVMRERSQGYENLLQLNNSYHFLICRKLSDSCETRLHFGAISNSKISATYCATQCLQTQTRKLKIVANFDFANMNVRVLAWFFVLFILYFCAARPARSKKGCQGCGKRTQKREFSATEKFSDEALENTFGRKLERGDLCCGCVRAAYRWQTTKKVMKVRD